VVSDIHSTYDRLFRHSVTICMVYVQQSLISPASSRLTFLQALYALSEASFSP
jgi:hypothetical protein